MIILLAAERLKSGIFRRPALLWLAALVAVGVAVAMPRGVSVAEAQSPSWNGLVPPGLEAGDNFRILFVTSSDAEAEMAKSDDIADYNDYVQSVAKTNSELDLIWFRILGSTEDTSARDNTNTNPESDGTGEPIYYMLGDKVADDYADLYDGGWDSTQPRDEDGNTFSGTVQVSTGTNSDGDSASMCCACYCQSIAIGTGDRILIGLPQRQGKQLHSGLASPSYLFRFYALSERMVVLSESEAIPVSMSYGP